MSKVIFIVPYFGRFPNYFQLVLNSMEFNKEFNWLIFTDNNESYNLPKNVKIVKTTFDGIKKQIQKKFDFKISLERPYKFCDFKPAYGYIFEEYLKEYDYWGYCDIDVIFGDLSKFITEDILNKYEKIFTLGHMTLYKNTYKNNKRFMEKYNGKVLYRRYLSSNENFAFDEQYEKTKEKYSINNIYDELGIEVYNQKPIADIFVYEQNFKLVKDFDRNDIGDIFEEDRESIFTYENGKILRYYFKFENFIVREYMYIHLQKREMTYNKTMKKFKIIPNAFIELEHDITEENFNKEIKKKIDRNYIKHIVKIKKIKLRNKLRKYKTLRNIYFFLKNEERM